MHIAKSAGGMSIEQPATTKASAAAATRREPAPGGGVPSPTEAPMGFTIDGKGGRQKPVNAELNLVPYIDLLTCMVAFLLITAVWTQLASLSVSQKGPG